MFRATSTGRFSRSIRATKDCSNRDHSSRSMAVSCQGSIPEIQMLLQGFVQALLAEESTSSVATRAPRICISVQHALHRLAPPTAVPSCDDACPPCGLAVTCACEMPRPTPRGPPCARHQCRHTPCWARTFVGTRPMATTPNLGSIRESLARSRPNMTRGFLSHPGKRNDHYSGTSIEQGCVSVRP